MKTDCVTQIKEWVLVSIIVPLLVLFLLCLDVGFFMAEVMAQNLSRGTPKEVICGEELGPGGYYKLANDLLCSCDKSDPNGKPGKPALTIVGPVTVDLNGKSIACEPCDTDQCGYGTSFSIAGIHVKGERATVRNGTIIRCNVGLVVGEVDDLSEEGHHKITNVRVLESQEVQYDVGVDDNGEVICNNFKGDGIVFESTHNFAGRNELLGNQNDGIDLKAGFNLIKNNSSIGNGGRGYNLDGDHNWSIWNQALKNINEGFEIKNGVYIRVINNLSIANGIDGIKVGKGAKFSSIKFNKAIANGERGILVKESATENSINFNQAIANEQEGIRVDEGATDNSIKFNKAIFNGEKDLRDKNDDCDNNTWRWNTYGTKKPDCIQ